MVNRAQELRQKVPGVRAVLTGKTSTNQLRGLLTDLKTLSARSVSLEEWTAAVSLLTNFAADAAKASRDAIQKLSRGMKTIVSGELDGNQFQLKDVIVTGGSDLRSIDIAWQNTWKSCIQNEFSGLGDLAQLLREIQGGAKAAEKLSSAAALALAAQGVQLPRLPERQKLIDAREMRKQALEELNDSGADREVIEFLSAVATGTCTLALVSDRILAWLKKNGQLGKFRVRRS